MWSFVDIFINYSCWFDLIAAVNDKPCIHSYRPTPQNSLILLYTIRDGHTKYTLYMSLIPGMHEAWFALDGLCLYTRALSLSVCKKAWCSFKHFLNLSNKTTNVFYPQFFIHSGTHLQVSQTIYNLSWTEIVEIQFLIYKNILIYEIWTLFLITIALASTNNFFIN